MCKVGAQTLEKTLQDEKSNHRIKEEQENVTGKK